jgi:hypothetical protein
MSGNVLEILQAARKILKLQSHLQLLPYKNLHTIAIFVRESQEIPLRNSYPPQTIE